MPKNLYKTTLVIWSDFDPMSWGSAELVRESICGNAYMSRSKMTLVAEPHKDPDWDGTEFFDGDCDEENDD